MMDIRSVTKISGETALSANADRVIEPEMEVAGVVEAVLFTGGPPVTPEDLAGILGSPNDAAVVGAVAQLNQLYHQQGRPYEIRRVGQGYQMVLRAQFSSIVRRLHFRTRDVHLSLAAVEVLSLVGYRQPVSLQEIDSIRGVDSAAIIRQLRRRNLIESVQSDDGGGQAVQFRTTKRFLRLFHLASLDDLPRVQELERP